MNYEELKKEYLERLKNTKEVLKELENFKKYKIFQDNHLSELIKINKKNEIYLDKLEKGEIELAIVGLENSGKSTFANAFIKLKEAFPTGSSRTTFTSTKLKYGENDKATVEFFTKTEFDNMFLEMLKNVKYPNPENVKFETMNIGNYKNFFESLEILHECFHSFHK